MTWGKESHAEHQQHKGTPMTSFTTAQLIERVFHRVAYVMHHMWQEDGCSDTRLLGEPLVPDKYVVVGESIRGSEYREHVIPRLVLCDECLAMFSRRESIEAVAKFLQENLKIVRISRAERHMLDSSSQLNLRQRMPDDWNFSSGDPFVRLKLANIEFRKSGDT
ncbi:hypothetical protein ABQJ54_00190 [Rhodanobacter sp. Si-c]|uniref:Uncharacterized protein n=1 Tax=Rhodanobacter lycopersici TaxID=3162487 RepID=A0ABV3Q8P9_9GAMM